MLDFGEPKVKVVDKLKKEKPKQKEKPKEKKEDDGEPVELSNKIKNEFKDEYKIIVAPGPEEIVEASNINAECILDNGKSLNISQLASLIKDSTFVIANDTGPAHISAHLGIRGLALFGPHKPAKLVSIEREKFRAIQVEDLNKLSADKVFERMLELLA